jgi:hypothetical protein
MTQPVDFAADASAHVRFPVEMLIEACLCTRSTVECLGTQGASESALSVDIGGGYRWSNDQCWSYRSHGRNVHWNVWRGARGNVGQRGGRLAKRYVLRAGLV